MIAREKATLHHSFNILHSGKTWDAGDVDCGIAQVNRATRARAVGTYFPATWSIFSVSPLVVELEHVRSRCGGSGLLHASIIFVFGIGVAARHEYCSLAFF